MRKLLSTNEIKEINGISYECLYNYRRMGWVQAKLKRYTGRGSSLFWSRETLVQLSLIKTLKKMGYKNKEIDKILI